MKIRAIYEPFMGNIGVYLYEKNGNTFATAQPLTWKETKGRFEQTSPTFRVEDKAEFQDLFDDLWSMGLRPSARSDEYKAQLETMQDHLNDMRCIVFNSKANKPTKKF